MAIKIVALGGSGAGKSLYLASLYRKLTNSLIIDDINEARKLNQICNDVLNTTEGEVTNPGTSDFKEWKFKWQLNIRKSKYNVGSFTYLDYAGGKINEISKINEIRETSKEKEKLLTEIKGAHIVVVFLDGVKLIDLIRQTVETTPLSPESAMRLNAWLNNDICNIIACLKRTDCPIHFVITKWDALVFKGFNDLRVVKNILTATLPTLQEFIDQREKLQSEPIRWIPISSLGMNIAQPIYDNKGTFNRMGFKRINGNYPNTIKPVNVDIVLSYAIIDTLKSRLKSLEKLGIVSKIVAIFGVEYIFEMLPYPFNLFKFAKLMYDIISGIREAEGSNNSQQPQSIDNIKNRKDALLYMIAQHQQKIEKFEEEFPPTVWDKSVSSPQPY
jgi:hypothetical protein